MLNANSLLSTVFVLNSVSLKITIILQKMILVLNTVLRYNAPYQKRVNFRCTILAR